MRQQQHLSVMPYLSISNSNTGGPNFKIILENNGVGPAFIESTAITYNDSTYEMDLPNFFYKFFPDRMDTIKNILHSNISKGNFIPAGRKINIFEVDNSMKDANAFLQLLIELSEIEDLEYEIIYQSIYKERWSLKGDQQIPVKL